MFIYFHGLNYNYKVTYMDCTIDIICCILQLEHTYTRKVVWLKMLLANVNIILVNSLFEVRSNNCLKSEVTTISLVIILNISTVVKRLLRFPQDNLLHKLKFVKYKYS